MLSKHVIFCIYYMRNMQLLPKDRKTQVTSIPTFFFCLFLLGLAQSYSPYAIKFDISG